MMRCVMLCSTLARAVARLLDEEEPSDSTPSLDEEEEIPGAEMTVLSMEGDAKGCRLCGGSMLSKCEVKSFADRALDELVCRCMSVELVPGVVLTLPDEAAGVG